MDTLVDFWSAYWTVDDLKHGHIAWGHDKSPLICYIKARWYQRVLRQLIQPKTHKSLTHWNTEWRKVTGKLVIVIYTHRICVWYIYLHLPYKSTKCS